MKYHFIAAFTAAVWGVTLISSKILLNNQMTPIEIMFLRFVMAYVLLWILHPKYHKINSLHDEFLFFVMGLSGCTMYFICENTALKFSTADNVGLICATVPLATGIMSKIILKTENINKNFIIGSLIAFLGVAIVILNGSFVLKLNPIGDLLALLAVIFWAIFCVYQKKLKNQYPSLLITRKIFFYGIVTMSATFLIKPFNFPIKNLLIPEVIGNLIFLGVLASGLCYWLWAVAIKNLGTIVTNNYIYFLPVITIIISAIFLDEKITIFTIIGTILIISGLKLTVKTPNVIKN